MAKEFGVAAAKDQLVDDFSKVIADTEALLKALASSPAEKAGALRASAEESLVTAKRRLRELQGQAVEKTTAAAKATDVYAHENPWPLIAGAAVAGFILGVFVASDRD